MKHTEDTKRKMSCAKLDHVVSDETKKKISATLAGRPANNLGKKSSKETKDKISRAFKGRKLTEEHRLKIGQGLKKKFCHKDHDTYFVGRGKDYRCRLCTYIESATKRQIPFTLTEREFASIVAMPCVYNCEECTVTGIDRIDNSVGYTSNNVQPMCGRHNQMKMSFGISTFKVLAAAVH